jgi:hypothetical protein
VHTSVQQALKVPQPEGDEDDASVPAPRLRDYVSVLTQMQQKTLKSTGAPNYTSTQQQDLSWQCTLAWQVPSPYSLLPTPYTLNPKNLPGRCPFFSLLLSLSLSPLSTPPLH